MKTLQNFKDAISKKFDKTVQTLTNRAIPIAKKEATKIIKRKSTKTVNQIIEFAKVAAITGAIFIPNSKPLEHVIPLAGAFEGVRDINITIDNLVINL